MLLAVLSDIHANREAFEAVLAAAPLRHLVTPGGKTMSVAMTNCGALGWVSDRSGYRYTGRDPLSDRSWPAMPASFRALAVAAASRAGFDGFAPDACLVNRYVAGARLTMHQDRDERQLGQPIVSVSLGLPAVFLWGGAQRGDRTRRVPLSHGDVVVWGGPARILSAHAKGLDLFVIDAPHLYARPGNPYLAPDGKDWQDNP